MSEFEFGRREIEEAARRARLLALEIELGASCSARCPQCYVRGRANVGGELSDGETRDVVLQAKDLGARRISILDGAREGHRRIAAIGRFVRSQELEVEVFTSGAGVTGGVARELFEDRVAVVLRMDSRNLESQDLLTGAGGSFELIQRAFRELRDAGYPGEEGLLRVDALVCRQNLAEIIETSRWLRDQDVACRFHVAAPRPHPGDEGWLHVDPEEVLQVFSEICVIERSQYGREWDPQAPRWGNGCTRHKYSCLVASQGDVLPCVGVDIPIGNVRRHRLGEIIQDSEILEDLRNHTRTIKGPCGSCEEAASCYGCRGAAYQWTGDYLASDPCCWRNTERQNEIVRLPAATDGIMPHEAPMRIVDEVVRVGERSGEVSVVVSAGNPFVGEDGGVDGAMYFELMAQSFAALNGFKQLAGSQARLGGYLVGARNVEILGAARVGDGLTISVYKDLRFGGFGILTGTVSRGGTVLARGEVKIWRDAGDVTSPRDSRE